MYKMSFVKLSFILILAYMRKSFYTHHSITTVNLYDTYDIVRHGQNLYTSYLKVITSFSNLF